jgi:hypothetical protein
MARIYWENFMSNKEYEQKLICGVASSIIKNGGDKFLSSVILTGSFGRNEPTFQTVNGELSLKSDVEIALVYCGKNAKKKMEDLITKVSSEFSEELNLMALSEKRVSGIHNFNGTLFTPKYKTLFTYDLFNGSKTIWGKDYIGSTRVTLSEIDIYEAKRIVANRIGELSFLTSQKEDDFLEMQWKGKLMLAIVSAWLLLNNRYVSSYHEQRDIIDQNTGEIINVFGLKFMEDYTGVFAFLRDNGDSYCVPNENLRNYVSIIDKIFSDRGINKSKVNSFSRKCKYLIK